MDQRKRLEILLKVREGLLGTLRSAIKNEEISPEKRSEALFRLSLIQREIEALRKSSG